jgi:hypothetical protein
VAAEDFTGAPQGDSTLAWREGFTLLAEVTMVTPADIRTAAIMGAATTADMVAMAGAAATTAGTEDIGAIHATVGDGVLVLALAGRTGVGDGDTRMASAIALGITLPTGIVLRDIRVLATGTMTLRLRLRAQNPGATHQSLGDRQPVFQTTTTRLATSRLLHRVPRFPQPTG